MKCVLSVVAVLALVAVGAWAIPSGYMYYKPGTPGIMYVQYQKHGVGSQSDGVSAFVAGESGDTMSIVDDVKKGEDILSEEIAPEARTEDDSVTVDQGYSSQSVAIADDTPNNEYLPPVTDEKSALDEVLDEENVSLTNIEGDIQEAVADEDIPEETDDIIPVAIADSEITKEGSAESEEEEQNDEIKSEDEEKTGFEVYGVPKVEESEREPKNLEEDSLAEEVKTVDEEVKTVEEEVKTVVEENVEDSVEEPEAPVADDDSTVVVEEPTPVLKEIPEPEPVPVVPVVPAPTKRTRVFPARRPNTIPQRKKDEEEYVPVVRQAPRPKKEQSPLPLGGTFFPIDFGGANGGAIAIANSFSTGKGGHSQSHAVAYGNPRESQRSRKLAKKAGEDCDC
uniref:DUF4794 domain-containing protein n=1 Tax=Megaselia scalaris TaxID=36166 RepID=T1GAN4_MEGSC